MKFRFFKRDTGTRRRSASCPNLDQLGVGHYDVNSENHDKQDEEHSCSSESESEVTEKVGKIERLQAQRSVRRVRQKEKEKQENAEKNLLSMDDYLGKLSELKIWLKQEKRKDPEAMRSPKLKAHFKTFVRLWNKRKLQTQYYNTLAVNLEAADRTLDLESDVMPESSTPRFPLLEDDRVTTPAKVLSPMSFATNDNVLSTEIVLEDQAHRLQLLNPGEPMPESPFSTFGKAQDEEDKLSSSALQSDQMHLRDEISYMKDLNCGRSDARPGQHHEYKSFSSRTSPTKFATISRFAPVSNTFKAATSPASKSFRGPVLSPKIPSKLRSVVTSSNESSMGKFTSRPLPDTPQQFSESSCSAKYAARPDLKTDSREQMVAGWNLVSEQSPVYASVMDAIPYSSGSPKYMEIDENGQPSYIAKSTEANSGDTTCHLLGVEKFSLFSKMLDMSKKTPKNKSSLNRRRSKSMEDIYAVPLRSEPLFRTNRNPPPPSVVEEQSSDACQAPPIPERNYSPQKIISEVIQPPPLPMRIVSPEVCSELYIPAYSEPPVVPPRTYSPRKKLQNVLVASSIELSPKTLHDPDISDTITTKNLLQAVDNVNPKKRPSTEGENYSQRKLSPPKKSKPNDLHSEKSSCEDTVSTTSHVSSGWSSCESSSCDYKSQHSNSDSATPKLSILTGSLRPTTRSVNQNLITKGSELQSQKPAINDEQNIHGEIGKLELRQLDGSPKFRRRKLKRRSSSLTVTPGKGLTFGKSLKVSTPSPRRVSFAKDVKDTECKSTPRRRSSTYKPNMMPVGGRYVTRQTRESHEFESFMSTHASPPGKGSSPSKVVPTLAKASSPIKTSLTNLLGGKKKENGAIHGMSSAREGDESFSGIENLSDEKSEDKCVNTCMTKDKKLQEQPGHTNSVVKKPSILKSTPKEDSLSVKMQSPEKQKGRRILGSPTKQPITEGSSSLHRPVLQKKKNPCESASNNAGKMVHSSPMGKVSETKHKLIGSLASMSFSKKPIHTLINKLSSKTSVLCADQVQKNGAYSTNNFPVDKNPKHHKDNGGSFNINNNKVADHAQPYAVCDVTTGVYTSSSSMKIMSKDSCTEQKLTNNTSSPSSRSKYDDENGYVQPYTGEDDQDELKSVRIKDICRYEQPMSPVMRHSNFTNGRLLRFDDNDEEEKAQQPNSVNADNSAQQDDVKAFTKAARIWNRTVGYETSSKLFEREALNSNKNEKLEHKEIPEVYYKKPVNNVPKGNNYAIQAAGGLRHNQRDITRSQNEAAADFDRKCSQYANNESTIRRSPRNVGKPDDIGFCAPLNKDVEGNVSSESKTIPNNSCLQKNTMPRISSSTQYTLNEVKNDDAQQRSTLVATNYQKGLSTYGSTAELPCPREDVIENSFILPPYPNQDGQTDEYNIDLFPSSIAENENSFILPPYPEISENELSLKEQQSFTLPLLPERASIDPSFELPQYPETEQQVIEGTTHIDIRYKKSLEIVSDESGEKRKLMQRIESLRRPSPKVVDNDSWVTLRRNSSRARKCQKSSRSGLDLLQSPVEQSDVLSSNVSSSVSCKQGFSSIETAVKHVEESTEVAESPAFKYETHQSGFSTPSRSKIAEITKPSTLPKTAKAIVTLAQRKLNVQNIVGGGSNSSTATIPSPKRRSSLSKTPSKTGKSKPVKNFIAMNKSALKKATEEFKIDNSSTTLSPSVTNKVTRKRSLTGGGEVEGRECSKGQSSDSENLSLSTDYPSSSSSILNQCNKLPHKRNSIRDNGAENRRRRSKSQGAETDDKQVMSFSERRKFFQRLQTQQSAKTNTPHVKGTTPTTVPISKFTLFNLTNRDSKASVHETLPQRCPSFGKKTLSTTPKTSQRKTSLTKKIQKEKILTLSPSISTDV